MKVKLYIYLVCIFCQCTSTDDEQMLPLSIDYQYKRIFRNHLVTFKPDSTQALTLQLTPAKDKFNFVYLLNKERYGEIQLSFKEKGLFYLDSVLKEDAIFYDYDTTQIYRESQFDFKMDFPLINNNRVLLGEIKIPIGSKDFTVLKYYEFNEEREWDNVLSFWIKEWGPIIFHFKSLNTFFVANDYKSSALSPREFKLIISHLLKDLEFLEMTPIPPLPPVPDKISEPGMFK